MELLTSPRHAQTLSGQQIQSMNILQMSRLELTEYIDEALLENPLLEAEEVPPPEENEPLIDKLKWLGAEDRQNSYYLRHDRTDAADPIQNIPIPLIEEDLTYHIVVQLDSLKLPPVLRSAARFIAASLDENGYLNASPAELAEALGFDIGLMEDAVRLIRTLEPAGVGAADLRDCLELQLARAGGTGLHTRIVRECLEKLSKKQYGAIAKQLSAPESAVRAASALIRTLDPKPGAAFSKGEITHYVRPDVMIVRLEERFEIHPADYDIPMLRINGFYRNLLENGGDKELTDYLTDKMRRAKWLINSIEQRRSTLIKCTEAILAAQEGFFRGTTNCLMPLTMTELAAEIGVHESTVSRSVREKYLQCPRGLYPLRAFFPRRLGDESASANIAKHILRELIAEENTSKPLSDQKIAAQLNARGIEISRRTIVKYRAELNLPNASGRKAER